MARVKEAVGDEKAAKQLQAAAKKIAKDPSQKPSASEDPAPGTKRKRFAYELEAEPQTPEEAEAALELPAPPADEEEVGKTVVVTNRAPLVLAFAVVLLAYSMPEQPLSSRLSLAQAVVSANARGKAVGSGGVAGASAEADEWGLRQPKVRIMGREIRVLKRGGYECKRPPHTENGEDPVVKQAAEGPGETGNAKTPQVASEVVSYNQENENHWAVSQSVTLNKSTFVARSIGIKAASDTTKLREALLATNASLRDASHNIAAWRVNTPHGLTSGSDDDGETGGGTHILQLLHALNLADVLVVVSRWYGGVMLGPERWRLITRVCNDALAQRLRVAGPLGAEALWGLDLDAMGQRAAAGSALPIHRPESARSYIMRAFASSGEAAKRKSGVALERERERNLGLLLRALDGLFGSWAGHVSREELDRKAWAWYVHVRPEVESGPAGWGEKGEVKLIDILNLRRKN